MIARSLFATLAAVVCGGPVAAQNAPEPEEKYARKADVIYGRRDGHALTMDVLAPKEKANGLGIIVCVSAGFQSDPGMLDFLHPRATKHFLDRGYTLFAVMHSSTPKYAVPEILQDMHRAVRYIKANAKTYKVDPDKLGITGASSGGHLSLMMGCDGKPGNPAAEDKVDRESSKVAVVACIFPVTDFLEFDRPVLPSNQEPFRLLFDIREPDPATNKLVPITPKRRTELGTLCSPLHCATKNAVPTFIIHGDKDELVPLKQSQAMIEKLTRCDVVCRLEVKAGMGHSAVAAARHIPELADWFDRYLPGKK